MMRLFMIFTSQLMFTALALCAFANVRAATHTVYSAAALTVIVDDDSNGEIRLIAVKNGVQKVLSTSMGRRNETRRALVASQFEITFSNNITLSITNEKVSTPNEGVVLTVTWQAPTSTRLADCIELGSSNWYGGPQQKQQYWPIEKLKLQEYSYVTKEADNCGIAEPYWLSSEGLFYFFDKKVPLFVDQNNAVQNGTCFIAQVKPPYSSKRTQNYLIYTIGIFENARQAHEYAVYKILKKPSGYPNERMVTYPIWSTWARYKRDINHDVVLQFADEIVGRGFPNCQLEIDDLWEICYGSLTIDVNRFPNMTETVNSLKSKGFGVTVWAHPFMNKGCEPWYTDAKNLGYLVSSEDNSVETSWWNDNGTTAAYIDFTKPTAREWYVSRLVQLQKQHGIDSYKFDGGETSWSPGVPVLRGYIDLQPETITADYVRAVASFGNLVEVRSGYGTQDLPIFVRMIDKDSFWTFDNGLPTLITTLLQMNMNGYTLVLPDMIGGNGYSGAPSRELFIRWLQANTFMPSMQFSYVPWDYDDETIAISKKFVDLHAQYAPEIIKALQRAVSDGAPVNAPLWWVAPDDATALAVWDEYLLGENILVAPVIVEGATSRDIYLPAGKWLDQGNPKNIVQGPTWLRGYSAGLDVLPYFVRSDTSAAPRARGHRKGPLVLAGFLSILFMFQYDTL
ncbi:myogenesis-regulating glycosidase-like [Vanessa cardui]|uniref:myogenesis-regulating glycosidase-like n=1 Tax=Vanessa cardui TaxID=171605 RepID=UPI001F13D042|nr:myogenesis-regulating glycosidase-like [Vanessa cardui]